MTGRPTLALLIPAYNAAAWLPRLLASAAAQTEPFDEIWVYDDASSDDTAAIAERLGAQVIRGAANVGCSAGKNRLAARTSADWVHFHDADDELMPNFVALAHGWIADGRHDVVLFAYDERDDATGSLMGRRTFDPAQVVRDPRAYAILNQINPFCGLYRRDTFLAAGGYDEDPLVLYNEDVAMHIGLAFSGLSFAAETEVSIINHRRMNSMSAANSLACIRAHYHVLRKTAERGGADRYFTPIASKLWGAAGLLSAHLDWATADAAAGLARRIAPLEQCGSPAFRVLASVSPRLALRAREQFLRLVRPATRVGYPTRAPEAPVVT